MAESSSTDDIVVDGFKDIAKRQNLDSVMVEAVGRKRFQKVFLWTSSKGGLTTTSYDPELHGHDKGLPLERLPHENETFYVSGTIEFLEVGLAYTKDTKMGLSKTPAQNKALSLKKKDKEPGRRNDETMMRVFTPVTNYIQTQNKFYGGCLPTAGRLNHYLITADCVFFYPEFYEGVPENSSQRVFGTTVLSNTRRAAAIHKTSERPTAAVITADELNKKLTTHPLVVTKAEHLANSLTLHWDLYIQTQGIEHVQAMIGELEAAHPDLKYGPDTSTDGLACFMDFNEPLANDRAELLCEEIKRNYPHIDPDVKLIKVIHAQLCKPYRNGKNRGESLAIGGFGFFIEAMHVNMRREVNTEDDEYPEAVLEFQINQNLDMTDIHMHHSPCSWTPSIPSPDAGKKGKKVTVQGLADVLTSMRDVLKNVITFSEDTMDEVAKLHGGVLKSPSFGDLMSKVADTVDRASLQVLFEQTCALHAALCARNNFMCGKILQKMVLNLTEILLVVEGSLSKEDKDGGGVD